MSPSVQKAFTEFQEQTEEIARKHNVEGPEWFDYLEECSGYLQCLEDCYKEEHPEDFQ